MIEFGLILIAAMAVVVGAILRPFVGRWIDDRNIERLRLRYSLDRPTAERLYRTARRDGFGSAWKTVIEGPPEPTAETGKAAGRRPTRSTARTRRSLVERPPV